LENLVNDRGRKRLGKDPRVEDFFDHIYWKDAGVDRESGKKTLTMGLFEAKYLTSFIQLAKQVRGKTLEQRFLALESPSRELIESLREFDRLYNVEWPKVHLRTAEHYLSGTGGDKAATGGSPWKKYLHPKFQQRKFFPSLWSDGEKAHWGEG
jgi:tryptophan 2,3-dioxygenase